MFFGATSLVGTEVLYLCLASDPIMEVITIGRNPRGTDHPRLCEIQHQNFFDFTPQEKALSEGDLVFIAWVCIKARFTKKNLKHFLDFSYSFNDLEWK